MRTALACVAMLAALGCSAAPTAQNPADVTFAQDMVPHHEQAIEMAKLVDGRTDNTKIIELADRVEKAQQPEIDKMNGWLKTWGTTHKSNADSHAGHGMVDTSELTELEGVDFDRQWLALMIEHHRGAVVMAKQQLDKGTDAEAKKVAEQIVSGQEKEIEEMMSLLPQG